MARSTRASSVAIALAIVTLPSVARAGDTALAESLFQEGKKLMAKKAYAEACPKLAESQRLDPGGGTLLSLALCHEAEGKTASAWSEFTEAAAIAHRDNRADRERIANSHAQKLEPTLHRLTIVVAAKPPGIEIKRDGTVIGEAAWGMPTPIDPGEHELAAAAPGKKPWTAKVTVGAQKEVSVTVPVLEDAPAPPPTGSASAAGAAVASPSQSAPQRAVRGDNGLRTIGLVAGGVGVAALAGGAFFGLRAASQSSDANSRCPQTQCPDRGAVDLQKDAQSNAVLSTVLLGSGAAALVGGIVLFVVGSSKPAVTAYVIRQGGGVAVEGHW